MTRAKRSCVCPLARHEHGTPACYTVCGCRCLECQLAYNNRNNDRRHGLAPAERSDPTVSPVGTRRRIQALQTLGWSLSELGNRLGMPTSRVHVLRIRERGVMPATAARVAALYDELWAVPSAGPRAAQVRRYARKHGWLPPLAWDDDSIDDPDAEPYRDQYVSAAERGIDEIAVAEAIRGRAVHLTPVERAEAVRRMTERGYSAAAIADRLGTTRRSVVRTRSARGIRGAA